MLGVLSCVATRRCWDEVVGAKIDAKIETRQVCKKGLAEVTAATVEMCWLKMQDNLTL